MFGTAGAVTDLEEGLLVVVEADGRQVGLFVDDLLGQQQVSIKSMEKNFRRVAGVADEFASFRPELLPLSTRAAPDAAAVQAFQQELQAIYEQLQPPPSTPVSQPEPPSATLPPTP
jgi:hypothetical protein